jgi:hypothetical protein
VATVPKRISDLDAAATLSLAETLLEIEQTGLAAGTRSRKLTLEDLLNQPLESAAKSADYTITGRDDARVLYVTTGATDRTITLPAGANMLTGDEVEVHKVDSGAGKVTVSRSGSDTIEGKTSYSLPSQYNVICLRWTGSYWSVVQLKANFDTGWISNSDWTAAEFTVAHNLGAALPEVIVNFYVSTDGTDANAREYAEISYDAAVAAAEVYGIVIEPVDGNTIKLNTGTDGLGILNVDGTFGVLDNDDWYYRVVIYRLA